MNEEQLNHLRLRNHIQVRNFLIDQLLVLVRTSTAQPDQSLQVIAARMRDAVNSMKFPQLDAAISLLAQQEYEEAIEDLLRDLQL